MSAGVQILLAQQLARLEHSLQKVEAQLRRSQDAKQAARAVRGLALAGLLCVKWLSGGSSGCLHSGTTLSSSDLTSSGGKHSLPDSWALSWLSEVCSAVCLHCRPMRCSWSPPTCLHVPTPEWPGNDICFAAT